MIVINLNKNKKNAGAILLLVLVYGAVFVLLLSGLFGFIFVQHRQVLQKVSWNQALDIAEAGINYYRWCLTHGLEQNCLSEKDYEDTSGNEVGVFSLDVDSTVSCGETIRRKIVSTGWTNDYPEVRRKVSVLYARTSVAKYSYILNSNVWIGDDHEIRGPYHSNGGVRMDGENQSTLTSAINEWACTSSFGCSPCPTASGCRVSGLNCLCPGVFTATANSKPDLFSYPVPSFNFVGITVDLAQMKNIAQSQGVYLMPSVGINPNGKGYYLKFFKDPVTGDGKFEAWIITSFSSTYAYSLEEGWHYDSFIITGKYLYNLYTIPSACSAIFVEDNLWIEGEIHGKVAVASANLIDANKDTDIILPGNVNYSVQDGSDGLTLIGERNVLIGPQSPNQMELRGIFVAQKGRFGRNHYTSNTKDKLEIYGSVISNGRVGTQWTSGSSVISGYLKRESYFDANLVYNPPVFTPVMDPELKMLQWEEVR